MKSKFLVVTIEPYDERNECLTITPSSNRYKSESSLYGVVDLQTGILQTDKYTTLDEVEAEYPGSVNPTALYTPSFSIEIRIIESDDNHVGTVSACLLWGKYLFDITGEEGTIIDAMSEDIEYMEQSTLNAFIGKWDEHAAQLGMTFVVAPDVLEQQKWLLNNDISKL